MAVTNTGPVMSESMLLTASAPSGATDGQPLKDLKAITVVVEAESTRTLSGAGTLLCYILDPSVHATEWTPLPAMNLTVSGSGNRRMSFPAVDVVGPRNGRVKWVASGVTVSAGTTVTVYQLGHNARKMVY